MALEMTICNRQRQTSKTGKQYIGYAVAFAPGQREAIPAAAEQPPFYVRDQRDGQQWVRLQARTLIDAKAEAEKMQHILQAKARGVEVVTAPDGNKKRLINKQSFPQHHNLLCLGKGRGGYAGSERQGLAGEA